jgi:hypothetical protein
MGVPSIRGHQGQIKLFRNGQEAGILNITRFEVSQDSSFLKSFYVGQGIPEGDQTVEGWSGSIDIEVKDDAAEQVIDAIISSQLAGIGVDELTMLLSELYGNGQLASYVYSDMQFRISKTNPGQNEKVTKRLDFQAMYRTRL